MTKERALKQACVFASQMIDILEQELMEDPEEIAEYRAMVKEWLRALNGY